MHICGVYKKYARVGDFDTPTHQPTNIYMYTHVKSLITHIIVFRRDIGPPRSVSMFFRRSEKTIPFSTLRALKAKEGERGGKGNRPLVDC